MVCIKGDSGAPGGPAVVLYVSVTGPGRMALPYAPDGGQISERTFPQAAPSLSRPSKRLAQDHTQFLAAKYSFSDLNFVRNDSDYASAGNCTSIFIYFSRHAADDVYLPASGVLPLSVPGGRIFGHLFDGINDRTSNNFDINRAGSAVDRSVKCVTRPIFLRPYLVIR